MLLVDDDETVRSGLTVVFEAHDFDVTAASGVNEALKYIANEHFDVLVTDLHMPAAGDGLTVVSAMRHVNPDAPTIILSAYPDLGKAAAALVQQADEVVLKPVRAAAIVEVVRRAMSEESVGPPERMVESAATILERERAWVRQAWLEKMKGSSHLGRVKLTVEDKAEHLEQALDEVLYRLRHPQELGSMTLFSMASLQHGAARRRQGFAAPVLVEEARALQVALFEAIGRNMDRINLGTLPGTLMSIADEVNAQLQQSVSGYENEKPVEFPQEGR